MITTALSRLIFVYNADGDKISQVKDFLHKIFRPSTYECNLCAISFSNIGMRPNWKNYITNLPLESIFLHRDEFLLLFPNAPKDFPIAYLEQENQLKLFISVQEMNELQSEQELIHLVSQRLKESGF